MVTLEFVATKARELAGELFRQHDGMACRGSPSNSDVGCLQAEEDRPLTRAEKANGWTRRPFYAYEENNLCNACCAYWHAERAAQMLHEMNCWRVRIEAEEARKTASV